MTDATFSPRIRAFIDMIEAQRERVPNASMLQYVTDDVPADAAAVMRALANHSVVDGFGKFLFKHTKRLSACALPYEADAPEGIQKTDAVCIASTAGGERYMFLGWVNGATHLFELDMEAESPDEVFVHWGTLDEGLADLAEDQRELCDDEEDLALVEDFAVRAKKFEQGG